MSGKVDKRLIEAGRRWLEHPSAMVQELFGVTPDPWQRDVLESFPHRPLISMQAPICIDSSVWTPSGHKLWGEVKPGDFVFAEDGTPTKVKRTIHVGKVPLFKVLLCDGTSVRCTGDHLWKVQNGYDRRAGKQRSLSTKSLMEGRLKIANSTHGRLSRQITIPTQGAAQFPPARLPFDPYVLGLWLGDGVAGEPTIVCPDAAIRKEILDRGFWLKPRRSSPGNISITLPGAFGKLRKTGMHKRRSYEKGIPTTYFVASIQQRLDLLRGLMDSDGTVSRNGQTYLATSSTVLVKDFCILARSLGYYATVGGPYKINGGKNRDSYRVTISGETCPFLADTSKKKRWKVPPAYKGWRFIESITPDGEGEAMCIEVEHRSHCFLIGNDFIVTHNCKGPGKTAVLAWLIWNFLLTRMQPKVACTSISGDNLKDNLWSELALWRGKCPLLQQAFEWTTTRIMSKQYPETWWASARTWPKSGDYNAQANTLAGLHADNIMFVLDESGGIPDAVMVSAEAALSSCKEGHILQAGNPTHLEGPLYRASKDRIETGGRWQVFEITGDPDDPKRSPRVKVEWAREQIKEYGRDSAWVLVNVFGKFPPSSLNALIGEDEVKAAMTRFYRDTDLIGMARIIGGDVARQGDDSSVLARRRGLQMYPFKKYRNLTGNEGASITNRLWNEFGADACFIDGTGGFGYTWIDQLANLGRSAIPVGFADEARDPVRYYNRRSEMAFTFVQWIKEGGALPAEGPGVHELFQALIRTTYTFKSDRLILEPKEEVKARIGFSPDEFDAAMLTFAEPVQPKAHNPLRRPSYSAVTTYSPFAEIDKMGQAGMPSATSPYDPFGNR